MNRPTPQFQPPTFLYPPNMRPIPEFQAVRDNLRRFTDYATTFIRQHVDITNTGTQGFGPDLPATTTLTPSAFLHKVYGPGVIQTIIAPANFTGLLMLCAPNQSEGLQGFSIGKVGNISIDKRIKVNQGVLLAWFPTIAKWQVLATVGDLGDVPASNLTAHTVLIGEGSDDIKGIALTNGQLPIGKNGADPVPAVPTTTNGTVAVTTGTGSLDFKTAGPYAPSTLTLHAPLVGEGTDSIVAIGPPTNGQLLIGSTGADPVVAALGVGNSIVATPGAGSLSIDAVQDIRTSAQPTFAGLTLSSHVNQGGGLKHQRVTTGSILAGATTNITLTWTTPFADANYTPIPMVFETTGNLAVRGVSFDANGVTVAVQNLDGANPHTGTLCVHAMHD